MGLKFGWRPRRRILRQHGYIDYPDRVCPPCGKEAARTSKTRVQGTLTLNLGDCDVCHKRLIMVAPLWDFGFPTFYTYENGQPVSNKGA